ncbi:hypothetical protein ED28_03200 [[Pantoea] beijingensis]|uniref:Uncharacterized protein n=1 Tax=[Pantoea] beijingensis TaxID=1324864 RepID=A0A443IGV9_9GAMM|nr:hypothetical protein ED28_03200 [[Pantoea] beijingensis]
MQPISSGPAHFTYPVQEPVAGATAHASGSISDGKPAASRPRGLWQQIAELNNLLVRWKHLKALKS